MKKILFAIVILAAACSTKKETNEEKVTVPSKFVLDSLLQYDSEADLITFFGKENVSRDTAWYPEGMGQYMISVLYPGTNDEVEFTWNDSVTFKGLQEIVLHQDSSQWSTQGVKIGSTLQDLIKLNGKDFTFSGFGWDYGGNLFWSEGGNLSDLTLTLDISNYDIPPIEQDSLLGDQTISSRSNVARKNNPFVSEIILIPKENKTP